MARHIRAPRSISGRGPRTDWSRWSDGRWVRLTRGADFPQLPHQALKAVRAWGSRHGLHVTGQVSGDDTIDIKIHK